jgi:hypothetical protein
MHQAGRTGSGRTGLVATPPPGLTLKAALMPSRLRSTLPRRARWSWGVNRGRGGASDLPEASAQLNGVYMPVPVFRQHVAV